MENELSRRLVDMNVGELLEILDRRDRRLRDEVAEMLKKEPEAQEGYIDADEVAEMLGISRRTVINKAGRSELPRYTFGGNVLFKRSEIIAHVEGYRKDSKREISQKASAYIYRRSAK